MWWWASTTATARQKAKADGLEVLGVAGRSQADWVMVLLPDEFQKDVYEEIATSVPAKSWVRPRSTSASSWSAPADVDVVMIGKVPATVRWEY